MIDIYLDIIDNYGDMAFAVKVINSYYYEKRETHFRLFSNNKELFDIFSVNFLEGIQIEYYDVSEIQKHTPNTQILNLFERQIDYRFLESFEFEIHLKNFSYFSLEPYKNPLSPGIQNFHGKISQNKNLIVEHFAVSLLEKTAGVFPESLYYPEILPKSYFTKTYGLDFNKKCISIFCYPETLEYLETSGFFENFGAEYIFLSFGNQKINTANILLLPFLNMYEYYSLLHHCNGNIVRGENSCMTALQTQKPFYWDIYKESNMAHIQKLEDFSQYLQSIGGYSDKLIAAQSQGNIHQSYGTLKEIFT